MNRTAASPLVTVLLATVLLATVLLAGCNAWRTLPPDAAAVPGERPEPSAVPQPRVIPAPVAAPRPARLLPDSPPRCLAEIEAFAEQQTGNRVMLGPAAFAENDQLVLARITRRGPDGTPLDGRLRGPDPVVLRLLSGPGGCSILGPVPLGGDAPRADLPACRCQPLTP